MRSVRCYPIPASRIRFRSLTSPGGAGLPLPPSLPSARFSPRVVFSVLRRFFACAGNYCETFRRLVDRHEKLLWVKCVPYKG
eukprot:6559388-Prymnesium_polylepis.1